MTTISSLHRLTIVLAAALSLGTAGSASAQSNEIKIGIVDMKRVFQEYHKTKDAEKKVNEDKSRAKKELDERSAKYRDLIAKWNDSDKILRDKLVNEELKQQKMKEAQETASEAKALEREIDEFRRRREAQLQEQVMRMRKGLLEDIKQRVEEKAKRDNYDLVFDKSGVSPSGVPFLLHSKDAVDFSSDILGELNKNAPKEAAAPEPAKPAAK
jgi:outer membrane protein